MKAVDNTNTKYTCAIYFLWHQVINLYSTPNNTLRPPSTPENPMNAKASKEAVMRVILMPRMPFGMLASSCCYLNPAKRISAIPNPIADASA